MKAILYIRVSTAKQVKEGDSLEMQENKLRKYAELKGFDEIEVITDAGLSGKNDNREGYQKVMEAIKEKKTNAVIVYSLSRFARNTMDTLNAINLMTKKRVAFHSLTENIDTTSPMGNFFITVMAGLAELERKQIGERTKAVLQTKRDKGERVGQIPFGKKLDKKTGKLVDHKTEQRAIEIVKELHKNGLSYAKIADELEQRNLFNKSGRANWNKTQVFRILQKVND